MATSVFIMSGSGIQLNIDLKNQFLEIKNSYFLRMCAKISLKNSRMHRSYTNAMSVEAKVVHKLKALLCQCLTA